MNWKAIGYDVHFYIHSSIYQLYLFIVLNQSSEIAPFRNQVLGLEKFVEAHWIVWALNGLRIRINTILKFLNSPLYDSSLRLQDQIIKRHDWAKDLLWDDKILFYGHSITFNHKTPSYTNRWGPLGEWTPLIGLGFSVGVKLHLASVKEILPFDLGMIIFIQGGEMAHAIEGWKGG